MRQGGTREVNRSSSKYHIPPWPRTLSKWFVKTALRVPEDYQSSPLPPRLGMEVEELDCGCLVPRHMRRWVTFSAVRCRWRHESSSTVGERFQQYCQGSSWTRFCLYLGAFHRGPKSHLVLLDKNVNGVVYRDILRDTLVLFARLPFVATPDCSPIEHLWDELGHAINNMDTPPPQTKNPKNKKKTMWTPPGPVGSVGQYPCGMPVASSDLSLITDICNVSITAMITWTREVSYKHMFNCLSISCHDRFSMFLYIKMKISYLDLFLSYLWITCQCIIFNKSVLILQVIIYHQPRALANERNNTCRVLMNFAFPDCAQVSK